MESAMRRQLDASRFSGRGRGALSRFLKCRNDPEDPGKEKNKKGVLILLTARVLSPTLDAMRPSMVPYSASRDVSLSIWLLWMRLNTRMATAERTMRMMMGATMTMASVATL
ncbi:hypothetical protein EYF80_005219 [Liparis tanakae]|uniref:Uncharacterized protein n=1 Tax=Liparis tanakae TaxID=230148 RepID=A0A4Z2J2S9_9TELE|nr:hypothetical protein EYF80_005219 [Liparis tanakae]